MTQDWKKTTEVNREKTSPVPVPLDPVNWKTGDIILKHYQVIQLLGIGGYATVYLVKNTLTGDDYAVKVPNLRLAPRSQQQKLFFREIRTWLDLPQHANLTECYFFRSIDDRIVIFSEYVHGFSLDTLTVRRDLMNLDRILDIAIQIAWGLGAAHKADLIHQDIKPANILIGPGDTVKITDFGLCRAHQVINVEDPIIVKDDASISTGVLTPAYCSYEQSARLKLDHRTDIWSFGLTLLTLFKGPPTWITGALGMEILNGFRKSPPSTGYPVLPDPMAKLIEKCLQKQLTQRWQSMEEVEFELHRMYREIIGKEYPRKKPEAVLKNFPISTHRAAVGTPVIQKWLDRAYRLISDDLPASLTPASKSQFSRKAQSVLDLEILEEITRRFVEALGNGREDLLLDTMELMMTLSDCHRETGDFPGAIRVLSDALEMIEPRDDGLSNLNYPIARLYRKKGILLMDSQEYEAALVCYNNGLERCQTDSQPLSRQLQAEFHLNLTSYYGLTGHFEKTLESAQTAISICREQLQDNAKPELFNLLCSALMNRGNALQKLGQLRQSIETFQECRIILQKNMDSADAQTQVQLARLHMNQGLSQAFLGEWAEGESAYQVAIGILQGLIQAGNSDHLLPLLAIAMENTGNIYNGMGDLEGALKMNTQAMEIREILYSRNGRIEVAAALASSYVNAGVFSEYTRRHDEAILYHNKAISLLEQCLRDSDQTALRFKLANTIRNKAVSLMSQANPEEALNTINTAIELVQNLIENDGTIEYTGDHATFLWVKALCLKALNQHEASQVLMKESARVINAEYQRTGRIDLQGALNRIQQDMN